MRTLTAIALSLLLSLAGLPAGAVELAPDHPERYTVVKGDTLWDIAGKFLKEPWRWPEIWKANPQVKNPNLIYPGDVLVLTYDANGKPELRVLRNERFADKTVKLSPAIYSEPLEKAIPTIPPSVIQPFLTRPLVVNDRSLTDAGYITVGVDDNILLGKYSQFYARGIKGEPGALFYIFRPGEKFKNPDTGETLGLEAIYLGEARMIAPGETAKLEVTDSTQEISPRDRLLPAPEEGALPYYHPQPAPPGLRGRILSALGGVAEVGSTRIVTVSLGTREGLAPGDVMRILRHGGKHKDPETTRSYQLPDEESGLLMVFRCFDKVSYALIMRSSRPVNVLDVVTSP